MNATKPLPENSQTQIEVWLIEDHADFRKTVSRVLALDPAFQISTFSNCEDALERLAGSASVHVVLLDIGLPGMSGLEGITRIKSISPATQIIMLTALEDRAKIRKALAAGASGYLLKTSEASRIGSSIRDVLDGGAALDGRIARHVLSMMNAPTVTKGAHGLAPRELEVLHGLVAGKTIKAIAADLSVSYHTVDTYLRRIYQKLDVQSRSLAVAKALQEGIV